MRFCRLLSWSIIWIFDGFSVIAVAVAIGIAGDFGWHFYGVFGNGGAARVETIGKIGDLEALDGCAV